MGKHRSGIAWLPVIAAMTVVLALPATAGARVKAAVSAQGNATWVSDAYDQGTHDDTKSTARDVTAKFAALGAAPYEEAHTLDKAPWIGTTPCDEDWYKFQITADDITQKRSFLIEAFSNARYCQPVIELYGPGSSFTPSSTPAWSRDPVSIQYSAGVSWFALAPSMSFTPYDYPAVPGWYYVRVRPFSWLGSYWEMGGPYVLRLKKGLLVRVAGVDRVDTALEISKEGWRSSAMTETPERCVVIANKDNFPDALAGAVLCGIGQGPLLLTPQSYLRADVAAVVSRLGVRHVYVLGGQTAVSDGVLTSLRSISPSITVVRIAGTTRIQTAAQIALRSRADAAHFLSYNPTPTVAFVVNSDAWADALAVGPLSTFQNVPVLLTPKGYLHPDVAAALAALGTKEVVIVGGTGVVSPEVQASLATLLGGSDHVLRIAGDNRYETAKEFAVWGCDAKGPGVRGDWRVGTPASSTVLHSLVSYRVGIASGETFADALAGGPICGRADRGCPLLLTPKYPTDQYSYIFQPHPGALPAGDTDYFMDIDAGHTAIESSRLFGGPGAVSDAMFLELDRHTGYALP